MVLSALRADVSYLSGLYSLPKIQVTKQKGTLLRRPFGLPSDFRVNRAAA
jgi:hypothetical protein